MGAFPLSDFSANAKTSRCDSIPTWAGHRTVQKHSLTRYFGADSEILTSLISKMLTVISQPPSYNHQPYRSSPLSMRDTNICSRSSPSLKTRITTSSIDTCKPASFKRQSKYRSLLKNKDLERDKRRDLFLKKVKQSGDDRKWEARGEQV